jgi:hypothetical protein
MFSASGEDLLMLDPDDLVGESGCNIAIALKWQDEVFLSAIAIDA